jgi:predicted CopG family antitoxin
MTTTVQVSDEVRQQMEKLKTKWGLRSYDEVIRRMIRVQTGRPRSLFGAARGSRAFVRNSEEEHEFVRD